jgi:hypothetical protein
LLVRLATAANKINAPMLLCFLELADILTSKKEVQIEPVIGFVMLAHCSGLSRHCLGTNGGGEIQSKG